MASSALHSHPRHPSRGPRGPTQDGRSGPSGAFPRSSILAPGRASRSGLDAAHASVQRLSRAQRCRPPQTSSGPPPVRLRPAPRWHGRPAGPRARCCHSGHPVLSCCCTPCPQLATASCLSRATSGLVSAGAPSLLGGCRWIPTPNSRSLELYILQSLRKTQRTGDPSIYPSVTLCCSGSPCDWTTSSSKCISEKFSNETVVSQT